MMRPAALACAAALMLLCGGCQMVLDLTVKGPIKRDPAARSMGTRINDRQLGLITAHNISRADPALRRARIRVRSHNGVVLLCGQVPSAPLRSQVFATASAVPGVRIVHNMLEIRGNTTFIERANDRWISAKIRWAFMRSRAVRSKKVRLMVENGRVFLMGILTQAQAQAATDIARRIGGVVQVDRAIEYLD